MNKKQILGIIFLLIIVIIAVVIGKTPSEKEAQVNPQVQVSENAGPDHKNISYIIDGKPVMLVDGFSEVESAPGSASKVTTRYFGNEIRHDLNNDGREDIAFILTQESGGTGTFYYLVAALNIPGGYIGSNAYLLGDRIAPQSTNIDEGMTAQGTKRENVIVVNFATRKEGEVFSAKPTVGKSVWVKLDPINMQFAEVAQNFEGESR